MSPRALASSLAALAALGIAAAPAAGHGSFQGAAPAPGQRLAEPPDRIVLLFSEPLNPDLSQARLYDARGGRPLAATGRVVGQRIVIAPVSPLPGGAYQVRWRSVSTRDAHPLEGSFGFGVRAPVEAGTSLQSSPLAAGGWVRATARAALYAALLAFAGSLFAQVLLGGRDRSWVVPQRLGGRAHALGLDPSAIEARARSLTFDAGMLALGLAALVAMVDSFAAAGRVSMAGVSSYLLTGPAGPARLGIVAFVGMALAASWRRPRLAALAIAAALACVTASGHAGSAEPRAAALALDFTHLLAGAVWLGGGAMLLAAWWPAVRRDRAPARREVARVVLPAFGAIALPAFVLVVVTGALSAAIELGRPTALWQTGYGVVLAVKVLLVAAIAIAAFVHVRRLRPRLLAANPHPSSGTERAHWALLRAEPALGLAVVAAAGLLVAFPLPPRQLEAAGGQALRLPACSPCPLPAPRRGELAVAELAGSQVVAVYVRRGAGGLSGRVRLLDRRGRPAAGPVRVVGATTSACGRGCFAFRLRAAPAQLRVQAVQAGRAHSVVLPARWRAGQEASARRLLERAERTMRGLTSVRQTELVSSGPGTLAVTRYRLRAPDRLAFSTGRGLQAVHIGRRQWLRLPGQPWRRRDDAAGGLAFSTRSWFSWTPYARAVTLVAVRPEGGRAVAEVALMDPGTPVWVRLWVDRASGRVVRERLVSRARRVDHRFFAFDAPVSVTPPAGPAS